MSSGSQFRRVTLFHAEGCHLCERAIEVAHDARARMPFDLELVDIGGVAALESAYRESLPVIEIDGVRAFTYSSRSTPCSSGWVGTVTPRADSPRQAICDELSQTFVSARECEWRRD